MHDDRNAGDGSRPAADKDQRQNQARQDATVYAQKGRPFCVSAEIAGTDLINQLYPSQTQVSKTQAERRRTK